VSCASGSFYVLPSYFVGDVPFSDILSAWVGMGGYGSFPLWQAGVLVRWDSGTGTQPYFEPFTQAVNGTYNPGPWVGPAQRGSTWPTLFIISICSSGPYPTASIEAWYENLSGSSYGVWWNETGPHWFAAYQGEVDWVVEDPTCTGIGCAGGGHYTTESFVLYPIQISNPSFTIDSVKTNEFLGPFAGYSINDDSVEWGNGFQQYITPGLIKPNMEWFAEAYTT